MNDAVEMTVNQFQQNISINLADDYLSTLLTENFMKFLVDLTKKFNSVYWGGWVYSFIVNLFISAETIDCSSITLLQIYGASAYQSFFRASAICHCLRF